MNISIEIAEKEQELNVKLSGEIDAYTAPKVREELFSGIETPGTKMIVDLSDVSYMDSTGLGVFVGLFKELKANDGQLVLTGMTDRLHRLFDITGLADVMDINTEVEGGV
ncbi:anti-sigma factor antagonist [Lederbergia citrea]|uniref:Anti-sigma factor antagonist n=1 Tax=Lederbergia citrea TaxID=2833581 RepID=A0A942UN35_9BACI|nr:anti-sigma factor antagonist [Lederbergia citrea]MBS4178606.1 anti-sigma factor antagonist [Lederbergia citrea]MBS4205293.1 anti-sigma factor antagonist [Lederbergia citrea]MBS4224395.1 anti-sigma factor antagonist [Lederbergia citrea]